MMCVNFLGKISDMKWDEVWWSVMICCYTSFFHDIPLKKNWKIFKTEWAFRWCPVIHIKTQTLYFTENRRSYYTEAELEYAFFVHSAFMLGRMLCFINGRKFFPIKLTDGKVILTSILFKIYQLLEILISKWANNAYNSQSIKMSRPVLKLSFLFSLGGDLIIFIVSPAINLFCFSGGGNNC